MTTLRLRFSRILTGSLPPVPPQASRFEIARQVCRGKTKSCRDGAHRQVLQALSWTLGGLARTQFVVLALVCVGLLDVLIGQFERALSIVLGLQCSLIFV